MSANDNFRIFTREGITAEILKEVINSVPPDSDMLMYVIGGAARNAVYYDIFKRPLPQRDYDLLLVGDLEKFVAMVRSHRFTYGKIRRKDQVVLKKKMVPDAKSITDYLCLDIHRSYESDILNNLKASSAFTINGFALPLREYLSHDIQKFLISLPGAVDDLKNHRLKLNLSGYKEHPGNLFACLRFMSIGFAPPNATEVVLLLRELPRLEKWRFERNVNKVFGYVGGEEKAREFAKRLGVDVDIFSFNELKKFSARNKIQ